MSSKQEKELEDMISRLSSMGNTLEKFQSGIQDKVKDIAKPLDSFRDLSKSIQDLKDIAKTTNDMSDSSSADEEDIEDIELTLNTIWDMVEEHPNNMNLGKHIRQLYNELKETTAKTDEANSDENKFRKDGDHQLELF